MSWRSNFIYERYSVKLSYNSFALWVTFLNPSCRNVAQSARLADLPASVTYFNEMSSAIRQHHMARVFNYLLSKSTFAFEVPRGRMRVASEDGNTFVCFIFCGHTYSCYTKIYNGNKTKYVLNNERVSRKKQCVPNLRNLLLHNNGYYLVIMRDTSVSDISRSYCRIRSASRKIIIIASNRYLLFACTCASICAVEKPLPYISVYNEIKTAACLLSFFNYKFCARD